ncbi:hypothetical protein KY362_05720 [Candidatus Woesearchaeota archaeon]|nr:hypothetical protein [Candidatus Woesearchaeota archaeon]
MKTFSPQDYYFSTPFNLPGVDGMYSHSDPSVTFSVQPKDTFDTERPALVSEGAALEAQSHIVRDILPVQEVLQGIYHANIKTSPAAVKEILEAAGFTHNPGMDAYIGRIAGDPKY